MKKKSPWKTVILKVHVVVLLFPPYMFEPIREQRSSVSFPHTAILSAMNQCLGQKADSYTAAEESRKMKLIDVGAY